MTLKINSTSYKNIYFNSDNHRNHKQEFLWKPRGFQSYIEHDNWIDNQFSKLTEKDLVIMLGDNALNSSYDETLKWFQNIKAKKLIIFGNHSSWDYPIYKKSLNNWLLSHNIPLFKNFECFPLSLNSKTLDYKSDISSQIPECVLDEDYDMIFMGYECNIKINNNYFFCRHMAPLIWDKMKYDNYFSICGHSHGNLNIANINMTDSGKILDVGVDNAIIHNKSAFFSIDEVVEIMSHRSIKIFDHHGDDHV